MEARLDSGGVSSGQGDDALVIELKKNKNSNKKGWFWSILGRVLPGCRLIYADVIICSPILI
jgi:hypothetical protein